MRNVEMGFTQELKALPENLSDYHDITPIPEAKSEREKIAAGLLRIVDSVEQGI